MSFLWTTKNADSIDVPNFSNHNDHPLFDDSDNKSSHGNSSKQSKHRVSTILKQIDTKAAKSSSSASVASGSQHCDEVSVLSLHSAFLTNNYPIREDAEFTTPLVIGRRGSNRSLSLTVNANGGSSRSSGLNTSRRSYLKASQHASFSTMTFSDKSLPISQEDIKCVEQSWIDNQQEDDQGSHRSSHCSLVNKSLSSPRSRKTSTGPKAKRRFSTQTYSDKGTVYSSIYKNFCDEESARSVASASFQAKSNADKSYFQSNSTVGSATRICSASGRHDGNSTRTTLASSSASNEPNQYEEVSLYPQSLVPKNTPSSKRNQMNEELLVSRKKTPSSKKRRNERRSNAENNPTKRNSTQKQSLSSSIKTDDNTLIVQNSRNTGKPPLPLSKSSSSSSLTDETTESKVQKELYRLSLELASTLSSLDFKKLEVVKYVKQVGELESVIAKLVIEKEQLETKLERYEMKERNAKIYKEKNTLVTEDNKGTSKTLSKKKKKKNRNEMKFTSATSTPTEEVISVPNCITPTSKDEDDSNPASTPRDESNAILEESEVLFPDLNESHLTCQDLYATMEEDDNDDNNDDEENNDLDSESSLRKIIEKDVECFIDNHEDEIDEDDDDDFPTEILDTTVSLIDPREEIFDDDPFATVYDYGKSANKEDNNEEDDNDHRSVISLQWIPFMKKESQRRGNETNYGTNATDQFSRKTVSVMNSSFRSTKTNMTAPVRKSNFFGFHL